MNLKPALFTLLIATLSFSTSAQIATPEKGSKWVYDYRNSGSGGPILASYDRDSVVGGKTAIVLDETFYEQSYPQKVYRYLGNIVALEDSLVLYWNISQWDTLYDFNSEVGDSWNYYFFFRGEDTLKATVLDKGLDPGLGVFISLEYEYMDKIFGIETWKDTIHELTLGGTEYIIPWDNVVMKLDGQSGGPLSCFSNSQGRYNDGVWTEGGDACTNIIEKLSVSNLAKERSFKIYPNPSSGKIFLNSSTNELPKRVCVMDAKGAIIYKAETLDQLIDLTPQLYFVKIERQDGLAEIHKVLVE